MIAALILVIALASQPPAPSGRKGEGGPPKASTEQPQRDTSANSKPSPSTGRPNAGQTQPVAVDSTTGKQKEPPQDWWTISLTGLLVIVGGLQVWSVIWQNRIMDRQTAIMTEQRKAAMDSAQAAAEVVKLTAKQQAILEQQHAAIAEQARHMAEGLQVARDTASAALKSGEAAERSAAATDEMRLIAKATLATNREIERAYIYISHKDLHLKLVSDGLGDSDSSKPLGISFMVTIRNGGRTPGKLLGGFVGYRISQTPGLPDITRTLRSLTPAFLLPDGHIEFGFEITVTTDPNLARAFSADHPDLLWIIGQAHYEDRFGGMHSGGYGRQMTQRGHAVSLSFVPDLGAFNFDVPLDETQIRHYKG